MHPMKNAMTETIAKPIAFIFTALNKLTMQLFQKTIVPTAMPIDHRIINTPIKSITKGFLNFFIAITSLQMSIKPLIILYKKKGANKNSPAN